MGRPINTMSRDQAAFLLKRRLMTLGAIGGGLAGVLWTLLCGLFFDQFPGLGSGPFLLILFLSMIVLGGAGMMIARWRWSKIVA